MKKVEAANDNDLQKKLITDFYTADESLDNKPFYIREAIIRARLRTCFFYKEMDNYTVVDKVNG